MTQAPSTDITIFSFNVQPIRTAPRAPARLYRVALLNQLLVFPRDTIARERRGGKYILALQMLNH